MDTQRVYAHIAASEPTNRRKQWWKCNKYCRYTPSIVSRAQTTSIIKRNMHIHHIESIGRWLIVQLVHTPFCSTCLIHHAG